MNRKLFNITLLFFILAIMPVFISGCSYTIFSVNNETDEVIAFILGPTIDSSYAEIDYGGYDKQPVFIEPGDTFHLTNYSGFEGAVFGLGYLRTFSEEGLVSVQAISEGDVFTVSGEKGAMIVNKLPCGYNRGAGGFFVDVFFMVCLYCIGASFITVPIMVVVLIVQWIWKSSGIESYFNQSFSRSMKVLVSVALAAILLTVFVTQWMFKIEMKKRDLQQQNARELTAVYSEMYELIDRKTGGGADE